MVTFCNAGDIYVRTVYRKKMPIQSYYTEHLKQRPNEFVCFIHQASTNDLCLMEFTHQEELREHFKTYIDGYMKETAVRQDLERPEVIFPTHVGFRQLVISLGRFCKKGSKDKDSTANQSIDTTVEHLMELFWRSGYDDKLSGSSGNGGAFKTSVFNDNSWLLETDTKAGTQPHIIERLKCKPPQIRTFFDGRICVIYSDKLPKEILPNWGDGVQFIEIEDRCKRDETCDGVINISEKEVPEFSCSALWGLFGEVTNVSGPQPESEDFIRHKLATKAPKNDERSGNDLAPTRPSSWQIILLRPERVEMATSNGRAISVFKMRGHQILATQDNLGVALRIAALNLVVG